MSGDDLTLFALGHVKGLDSGEQKESGANGVVNEVTVNGAACIAFTRHSRLEKVSYQHKFAAKCTLLSKLSHSNVIHFLGVHMEGVQIISPGNGVLSYTRTF